MPLSYSKTVIKSEASIKRGSKLIETIEEMKVTPYSYKEESPEVIEEDRFQKLGKSILMKAKESSEEIIKNAHFEAESIRNKAYRLGYEEGKRNGHEDGYKEAYEENIEEARKEATEIINQGEKLLLNAKSIYEKYICEKENEIVNLSLEIAENMIREKLCSEAGLNKLVLESLETVRNIKTVVIKTNSWHRDSLEKAIVEFKQININVEVFVLQDDTMERGNVEIITDKGKVKAGIETAIKKINETFNKGENHD